MAEYQMVSDLTPWEEYKQTIKVKVLKRWETVDSNGKDGMYFILVDESGSRVAATVVDETQLSYFQHVFQEGVWVRISQFGLANSGWNDRSTKHAYKIILSQKTNVNSIRPLTDDPFISFVDFASVINRPYSHYYLIDLLGVFDKNIRDIVEDVGNDGKTVSTLHFRITNIEGNTLECVAHGDLAYYIKKKSNGEVLNGPTSICALTDWMVKKSINEITINNYEGGKLSRFLVHPPLDEVYNLRAKMWVNVRNLAHNASSSGSRNA
ncbi:uncharacterized protein LOC112088069 [Eutrema salsugineum]|uniref:uncharacterized protein LOC112088069 n=1 Tax=Eutrema salsugineum TaxID=72664 RepID=UPI000CECFFD4|nr:uncharacterized protein LOC112088069 [Eutrema salsugineum]